MDEAGRTPVLFRQGFNLGSFAEPVGSSPLSIGEFVVMGTIGVHVSLPRQRSPSAHRVEPNRAPRSDSHVLDLG
ncbi:MAG: hypothetical protein RL500_1141 [Pseudomonadota bacterium]